MKDTDTPKVLLLDDAPATKDAFGPHQRIANAIRDLVSNEVGGRSIALIGSWGGGKSTVINLLKQAAQPEATSDLEVFVFDAWAHEGDPLRRTFLEKLIHCLVGRKWVAKEKWFGRLDELSRRSKESITTTTPVLTTLGSVVALLLFLAAIGLALVSGGYEQKYPLWSWSGIILAVLPIIILVPVWCVSCVRRYSSPTNDSETSNLLGVLMNKQRETEKTQTVEAPEPTSVEFESWFRLLAEEALSSNRKLLIVVDNLDRVDAADALTVWAAMRAFTDFSSSAVPQWSKNLWVLAAFDEGGITTLWTKKDGAEQAATFLEKTFQIRFRIPAPLLSDWRAFLMEQLKKAFPQGNEQEFYTVSRIYAILKAEKKTPTPRDIKVFVNQIGAISRTSAEPVPLAQQALFVALTEQGWNPSIKELPEQKRLESYLGANWYETLVALYYNMPRQTAMQVLLRDKVETAMTEGKPDLLRELTDRTGIEYVIEEVLDARLPDWRANDPYMIGRAAYALSGPGVLTTYAGQTACARLLAEARNVPTWSRLDKESGRGISALLNRANDQDISRQFIKALADSDPVDEQVPSGGPVASPWGDGILEVLKGLANIGHDNLVAESFTVCKSPAKYINLLSSINAFGDGRDVWRHLLPGCPAAEVVQTIHQAASSGSLAVWHELALEVMLKVDCPWPWNDFTGAFTRLSNTQRLPPAEIGRNLRVLIRLRANPVTHEELVSLSQNGWLFWNLHLAQAGGDSQAIASAVLVALLYDPEATAGSNQQLTPNGRITYRSIVSAPNEHRPILDEVVLQVTTHNCIEELLSRRTNDSVARPMFDAILSALAQNPKCHDIFRPNVIVAQYSILRSGIDEKLLNTLLSVSLEQSTLEQELVESKLGLENSGLYRRVLQIKRSQVITGAIVKGLKALAKEDWAMVLDKPGDLLPLVADLQSNEVTLSISYPLQDALSEFADRVISQQIPEHINADVCRALYTSLASEQRKVFRKNLCDKVIAADASVAKLISLFPDAMKDCEILASNADELVRVGFRKILDRREAAEYEWMKAVLSDCSQILDRCPSDTKKDFGERMQGIEADKLSVECRQLLATVANVCGVPLGQAETQHDTQAGDK